MPRIIAIAFAAALALQACSCAGRKPVRIETAPQPETVTDERSRNLSGKAFDEEGKRMPRSTVKYRGSPVSVVDVAPDGAWRCVGAGDATLVASAGEVKREIEVRCRPLAGLEVPDATTLVLGQPAPVPVSVIAEAGGTADDVQLLYRVTDEEIVRVVDGMLVPGKVGTTEIQVVAGAKTANLEVEVRAP